MFSDLKNTITKETDVAIGDENFSFNPFKKGDTVKWGVQSYLILEVTHTQCLLSVKGGPKWVSLQELS